MMILPMVAAASLALSVVHLMIGWRQPRKRGHLPLAMLAIVTAGMAMMELRMVTATTPEEHALALRIYHLLVWLGFGSIFGFVILHLRSGRWWLGAAAVGVRTIAVLLNFTTGLNLNFLEVTGLRQVPLLGGTVVVAEGKLNPMMAFGQLSLLLLLGFVLDAAVTLWRRGERRQALVAGGGIVGFVFLGSLQGSAAVYQWIDQPQIGSPFFLGMLIVMAFEASREVLRASEIEEELKTTREEKIAEVAHLGRVATFSEVSVTLAHEMNQPLGMILSNAQAAQRLLAEENPDLPKVREILGDIVQADLRASEVIKSMRAMLKRGEVRQQEVDLNELVQEVLKLMRTNLKERGVAASFDPSPALPSVSGDRIQLQQVLLNLTLNACEAVSDNPRGERNLTITTSSDGRTVCVTVTDCGCGLPPDIESIFQPFHTTKEEGLGMGLAICRSIVNAHQGALHAENNSPCGASFHLILPAMEYSK